MISVTIYQQDKGEAFLARTIITTARDSHETGHYAFGSLNKAFTFAERMTGSVPQKVESGSRPDEPTWRAESAA